VQEVRAGESSSIQGLPAWSIAAGRKLLFGPEWAESPDRLVFDACSGDYWVLDQDGHAALRSLLPLTTDGGPASSPLTKGATPDDAVLTRLFEVGLIEPLPASPRV
jgi:hypothetical protein